MRTQAFVLALLLAPLAAQDQGTEPPAMPEVGKAAPVIRLNDHTGTVKQVGGEAELWTVLAFYPRAGTRG
jgi:hypothetical protein